MTLKLEVLEAIASEREYQEQKWPNHVHTPGEWLLIMEKCLNDAKLAWVTAASPKVVMHEIRQVVAVGFCAMEQCGAPLRVGPVYYKKK